ncbi:UNVERIFIED_CONTAM: LacI family transcriptional regulator [Mumia flava]|uniref:LacI family DNA-binding transcriptional regulator n=1 Tax=Mumia flava TaxID=1348852 RepID=UPI0005744A64|nr:LacI family DNA-binding transcriptional regulator [Mumia flava]
MKPPTIYDVAARAGVAASTVSRALHVPGRISEATRAKVLAAADELGYAPAPSARRPRARHATVAMVLSDITNPRFFETIRGAEQRARAASTTLVLVNAEESAQVEHEQIDALARTVDGFVLAASRLTDDRLRAVAALRPTVLLDRQLPGLDSVTLDTRSGCRRILEHLAALGHASFTYCAGPVGSWMGAKRWAALREGAETYGLLARRVGPYTPTVASGRDAADTALESPTTAIVAHNDLLAIGVMQRLAARGVRVPADVSVIGFDDVFAAALVGPSLTTLGGPGAEAGRLAVDLLLDRLGGAPGRGGDAGQVRVLPTQLVQRQSTGAAAPLATAVATD